MQQLHYVDAFDRIRPNVKDSEKSTCRYGTRIDYVWLSPSLAEKVDWARSSVTLLGGKISDHRAVTIKFHPIA
jgi:exonuclease III